MKDDLSPYMVLKIVTTICRRWYFIWHLLLHSNNICRLINSVCFMLL